MPSYVRNLLGILTLSRNVTYLRGGMYFLVKQAQQDLPGVEDPCVGLPAGHQLGQDIVGNGGAGLVVRRHAPQRSILPTPVLQHLRWSLYKVALHVRATGREGNKEFRITRILYYNTISAEEIFFACRDQINFYPTCKGCRFNSRSDLQVNICSMEKIVSNLIRCLSVQQKY